jgi:hypothetical protein
MKRFLVIHIALLLYSFNPGFAQQTYTLVTDVKTPNNSIVEDTYVLTSPDVSYTAAQLAALSLDISLNYNGAELIDAPSYKYNCHAYAWHTSEGGSKVWMGREFEMSEDIYWKDCSYIETTENLATKVSYYGNHSANRLK